MFDENDISCIPSPRGPQRYLDTSVLKNTSLTIPIF